MFYTRPDIPPLGLNLVEASKTSSFSRFRGRTSDGRSFEAEYNQGFLNVSLTTLDVSSKFEARKEERGYQIGSPLDQDIALEQVCSLLGLTLHGKSVDSWHRSGTRDWTGETTYWERRLKLTADSAYDLLEDLSAEMGSPVLLEENWQPDIQGRVATTFYTQRRSLYECKSRTHLLFPAGGENFERILDDCPKNVHELRALCKHLVSFQFPAQASGPRYLDIEHVYGTKLSSRIRCLIHVDGSIVAEFQTVDSATRSFIERVDAVCAVHFMECLEAKSSLSGIGVPIENCSCSLDLVDASKADRDLYLGYSTKELKRDQGEVISEYEVLGIRVDLNAFAKAKVKARARSPAHISTPSGTKPGTSEIRKVKRLTQEEMARKRARAAPIVIIGNCIAEGIAEGLKATPQSAYRLTATPIALHLRSLTEPESLSSLSAASQIFVQDIGAVSLQQVAALKNRRARVWLFPGLTMRSIWPFTSDHNSQDPAMAFQTGDVIRHGDWALARLRDVEPNKLRRIEKYRNLDFDFDFDFDRLAETQTRFHAAIDQRYGFGIGQFLETNFRKQQLFYDPDHPAAPVFKVFCEQFWKKIVAVMEPPAFFCSDGWADWSVPVHPLLGKRLGLTWAHEKRRYRYVTLGDVTWDEWVSSYIDILG